MKRFASAAVLLLLLVPAGCGSDDDESSAGDSTTTVETKKVPTMPAETETTSTITWSGPPQPAEDGTISTEGFNEYAQTLPESKRNDAQALALEFVRPQKPYTVASDQRLGGTTFTITRTGLEDDSVRAIRYVLGFALVSGGEVKLMDAKAQYQCHEGRGHQEFSSELCL